MRVELLRAGGVIAWALAAGCGSGAAGTSDAGPALDSGHTDAGPPWRSALYPDDWTPATTGTGADDGLFLHDFSYAGYHNGEQAPPVGAAMTEFPVTADPTGATDSTAVIQAAIDAASVSGGVVTLPAGTFRVDGLLHVAASHVVVRGAGSGVTRLRFLAEAPGGDSSYLRFAGAAAEHDETLLTVDGAARSHTITVPATAAFHVGDDVIVGAKITEAFIVEHGMHGTWDNELSVDRNLDVWKPFFRRTVTAVSTDGGTTTITLDVPLRYPMKTRDGASIRRVTGLLREVGVEGLAFSNMPATGHPTPQPRSHGVGMADVADGWMHDVASFTPDGAEADLRSGGLFVQSSKRVTIDHCAMKDAYDHGDGGAGYLFEIMQSSEVMVADSSGIHGRHNFIFNWDFGNSGHVLLRDHSADGLGANPSSSGTVFLKTSSEFHHSLTMAVLIDSCDLEDGFNAVNRGNESSGAGHAATESVFWHVRGGGQLLSYQAGHGYVIGTTDMEVETALDWPFLFLRGDATEPADYAEGVDDGESLMPSSLYEDQLARRLSDRP